MKKLLSVILSLVLVSSIGAISVSAKENKDYNIISPYADVIWEDENA